jgi:hypothetical protein
MWEQVVEALAEIERKSAEVRRCEEPALLVSGALGRRVFDARDGWIRFSTSG